MNRKQRFLGETLTIDNIVHERFLSWIQMF